MKTKEQKKRDVEAAARWRKRNPDKVRAYQLSPQGRAAALRAGRNWRLRELVKNPRFYADKITEWRRKNPESWRAMIRKWKLKRYHDDEQFRLRQGYSACVYKALRKFVDTGRIATTSVPIGCSIPKLKEWIESKWAAGMKWENWSRAGWQIDHKKPLTAFDLTDPLQVERCYHYRNTQPLWHLDNWKKGGAK